MSSGWRSRCPVCRKMVVVTDSPMGTVLSQHMVSPFPHCDGSGKPVAGEDVQTRRAILAHPPPIGVFGTGVPPSSKGHVWSHESQERRWCVRCGTIERTRKTMFENQWISVTSWATPGAMTGKSLVEHVTTTEPSCEMPGLFQKQTTAILHLGQLALLGRQGSTVEVVRTRLAELGLQLPEKGAK